MKYIILLWCLFAIGQGVYIKGSDPYYELKIVDVYSNKKGECVYKIYHPIIKMIEEYEENNYGDFYDLREERILEEVK